MKRIYLIAVLVAIITGVAVFLFFSSITNSNMGIGKDTSPVVIAVQDIGEYTVISEEMVQEVRIKTGLIPSTAVKSMAEVVGKTAKVPMVKGEQILLNKIVTPGDTGNVNLVDRIKPGYRAYTILIDDITGVANYLQKGYKVDIISTKKANGVQITTTIAQNIEVLALGNFTKEDDKGKSGEAKNITLHIPAEMVTKIFNDANVGFLSLSLRGVGDEVIANIPIVSEAVG